MKNLPFIAIAGIAMAIAAPNAFAQLPSGNLNPADFGGAGAGTITVTGEIEQSLLFTDVSDRTIELGNIGGATNMTRVESVSGTKGVSPDPNNPLGGSTAILTKDTDTGAGQGVSAGAGDGSAHIDFQSNTGIQVTFTGGEVTGPQVPLNGGGTAPRKLPTYYRVAPKGKVTYHDGVFYDGPGTAGQTPSYQGAYGSYTPIAFRALKPAVAGNTSNDGFEGYTLRFHGGGPTNNGAGGAAVANASSGFYIMTEVDRMGTNDPAGTYGATLTLTYSAF